MAVRLRDATSPYLLQHADNPVDWWQWGEPAFEEARRRDVPVLLSVGYSACHWCHVMAHESFEDQATADLVNDLVVPIKVDREERPDVDAVYMTATQAITGQGGWPMTVFLTPDRQPFYAGTYYPREHFKRLITAVASAWRDERENVIGQAGKITEALAESVGMISPGAAGAGRAAPGSWVETAAEICDNAVTLLARRYDARHGGFGGAPKFPPSTTLEFLLRTSERGAGPERRPPESPRGAGPERRPPESPGGAGPERRPPESPGGAGPERRLPESPRGARPEADRALAMAAGTAEAMARGGIYDQLGGGFARYSVDAEWVVPHFEKMLYDNAQLAGIYTHWWRRSRGDLARRIAVATCDWMIADLRTAEGGFASAYDADSDGEEGAFYVWTPGELTDVLGADDGAYAAQLFAVTEAGTFEHGRSVLQLPADPDDPGRYERVRSALLAARRERAWPGRDDKVVAGWNGLAIGALAEAGLVFDRPDYIEAGTDAGELLVSVHLDGGRLARASMNGVPGRSAGVLEDYANAAAGFLTLAGVTGRARWVAIAADLLETTLEHFRGADGGFYDTADDSERLIYRPADPADGPTASGTYAVAGALLSYSALTGSERHREAAVAALGTLSDVASRFPQGAGWGLAVAEAFLAGPDEIAIVGPPEDGATRELQKAAAMAATPGAVIALGAGPDGHGEGARGDAGAGRLEGARGGAGAGAVEGVRGGAGDGMRDDVIPLLAGRDLVDGRPAAYVCRNFTCRLPVTSPDELRAALGR